MASETAKRKKGEAAAKKQIAPEPCAYCSAEGATLPCKGCGEGRYCDKQCFTKHWPRHRRTCSWRTERDARLEGQGGGGGRGRSPRLYLALILAALIAAGLWHFSESALAAAWRAAAEESLPLRAKRALRSWRSSRNMFILLMRHQPLRFFTACLPLFFLLVRVAIAYRVYKEKTQIWAPEPPEKKKSN